MLTWLRRFKRQRAGFRAFRRIPRSQRRIVFYSEGRGYWSHFEPVFSALREAHGETVLYVSSAEDDPVLLDPPEGLTPFYIGAGSIRTLFFASLDARVLLMTMPDLQTFQIKRSPHPVHYVYLHHSLVSTHMVYRPAAFDHFDAVLCCGPHHVEEIRAREGQQSLPAKTLVEHGYGRLDGILAEGFAGPPARSPDQAAQVLVAPSWGEHGLIETHGADCLQPLLDAGFRVVLRPHPRTARLRPRVIEGIVDRYRDEPRFLLDEDVDARATLLASDLMVSDWSGAALDFALGLERPVLFVDVPRKVNNPDYGSLGITPLEVSIRQEIGRVVTPEALISLGEEARRLMERAEAWQEAIRRARRRWVFNPGSSGSAGAEYLVSCLRDRSG